MVKHTQTIRRQVEDELFECVSPFCDIGAKRVNNKFSNYFKYIRLEFQTQPSNIYPK